MSTFGAQTPFILIARCHVKEDRLQDYLQAAEVADAAVKASEPGMLHHTFDQDPDDPLAFVWSEVYASDAALLFHLTNPPLVKFVEQHGEMGDDFAIEVYGTLARETKEAFSAAGFPIRYFDTKLGYSRVVDTTPKPTPPPEDTTFATFTPSTKSDTAAPVLLFQSGYGSTSAGHQPLMQKIADAGYVCVIPDRERDVAGGKESIPLVFAGLAEGKSASEHNALSTTGAHLAAALRWIKSQTSVDGQPIDVTKVAAAGFSMGCIEAIQAAGACAAELAAVVVISSSTGLMLEKLYEFSQADLEQKVSALPFPSLFITSDQDCQLEATKGLFEQAAAPSSLLVFTDSVLDNSMQLTDETSIWSPAVNDMLPGVAQHFALAAERGVVSDAPIIAFLNEHLKGAAPAPLAPEASIFEQRSKPAGSKSSPPAAAASA